MSYKWPNKDKDETLDYSIDWSRFLYDGETIVSSTWYVDDAGGVKQPLISPLSINGIINVDDNSSDTVSTITLSGGTNNARYKIYCQITTSRGMTVERTVTLMIKER